MNEFRGADGRADAPGTRAATKRSRDGASLTRDLATMPVMIAILIVIFALVP